VTPRSRFARGENFILAQPAKLDLIINLKTAKALGLTMPVTLLARADAVIA
jgi:putative tryptophan/tyrosine transport system substrate-binding protein